MKTAKLAGDKCRGVTAKEASGLELELRSTGDEGNFPDA